ncbi:hypothetical protein GCM10010260_80310 [Streptomyces filipinensis]|uniref:Uncharacterized protein n=1 Tax=Streptomyces filipinensis TaxID=66887 RepID=A0A918IJU8_9ACTN|nr:hypothetical protein GCM10010260_80310 [Streptomyces filipinensis]
MCDSPVGEVIRTSSQATSPAESYWSSTALGQPAASALRGSVPTGGLAVLTAGALLVGCSASVTVNEKPAARTGRPKPRVTCPEDLAGKAGTTTRRTLTADDGARWA